MVQLMPVLPSLTLLAIAVPMLAVHHLAWNDASCCVTQIIILPARRLYSTSLARKYSCRHNP
jgi:hypothetical protein